MSTRKWLEEARNYATTDNILLVLVANKIDLDKYHFLHLVAK